MTRSGAMRYLSFAAVTVVILVLILEGVIRLAGVEPRVDNPFFMLVRVYEYPEYFKKDKTLFWRLRANIDHGREFLVPGDYRTNSLGLRGSEPELETTTATLRIACLGNSCTFGWRLAELETYPMVLQQRLAESAVGGEVSCFNCGIPGYSSFQGLRLLHEYQPLLQPDFVTICYGWNDQWAAGFDIEDKDQQMPAQFLLDLQNRLSQSYLYRTVKYLLLSGYEKQKEYTFNRESPRYRVSLTDYHQNLLEMVRFCRSRHVTPILITAPLGDVDPPDDLPYEIYHRLYNQMTREVAAEYRVLLLDAAQAFAEHPEFFDNPAEDYIHYNHRGAAWIGQQLELMIGEQLKGGN